MIIHHQRAIDMAKVTKHNANHEEIKNLADDIISSQTKEISLMEDLKSKWGFVSHTQLNYSEFIKHY